MMQTSQIGSIRLPEARKLFLLDIDGSLPGGLECRVENTGPRAMRTGWDVHFDHPDLMGTDFGLLAPIMAGHSWYPPFLSFISFDDKAGEVAPTVKSVNDVTLTTLPFEWQVPVRQLTNQLHLLLQVWIRFTKYPLYRLPRRCGPFESGQNFR